MSKTTAQTPARAKPVSDRVAGHVLVGALMAAALLGGVGGWAAKARISGAVIASGAVKVDQNLKVIQHRDGGVVSEIGIREGDSVAEGQVLIRLDDTAARAELSIIEAQIAESEARRARLVAHRDGAETPAFPAHLLADPAARDLIEGEAVLHAGNMATRRSQKQQLALSIQQIEREIAGLESQRAALTDDLALVTAAHERLLALSQKNLVEESRLNASERELVQIRGRMGEIDAAIARARLRIGETEVSILTIDETARTEAQKELGLLETRLAELNDRRAVVGDRLARTEIRAPIAGTINELNVNTVGGVITPAEVLATIVPQNARLTIEVQLPPTSVDQVFVGQPTRLRFSGFNHRTTPELAGTVTQVAPATTVDKATGQAFYTAQIGLTEAEKAKLGDLVLLPGMPTEVYIATQEQTVMAYLAKPIMDQVERAFREE
ncbi:MAG: HlyD family type I secretion periplasmic adaptor subunit [Rhodobacteraceae bacterium]|nr:HlyD family type I secretion periplasmic adaptor subunit [Paracoccaceae bacterium]